MPRRRTAEDEEMLGKPGRRASAVAPVEHLPTLDVMPPVDMSKDGRAVWFMTAPALIQMKILRTTDALTFSIFCESFARYAKALLALRREGDVQTVKTVSGDKMKRLNPRIKILKDERDVVLNYASKFGLTPIDRYKVLEHLAGGMLPPPNPNSADPERDLLDLDASVVSDAGSLTDPLGALG